MREIKFRAWLTNSDSVTYSNGNHMEYNITLVDGKYADVESDWDIHGTYDYPVMQFTGLKDKNGKEIYEGDIVEFENGVWKIYFAEGAAQFRYETLQEDDFMDMSEGDNCEIIGNIYENPELIKENI